MVGKVQGNRRSIRHKRIRARIRGTAKVPRLCVFRSNKHIYAQLVDDEMGETLISVSDLEIRPRDQKTEKSRDTKDEQLTGNIGIAREIGKLISQKANKRKIDKVVFDRGGYKYHGRVKALAEGAREGGLKF